MPDNFRSMLAHATGGRRYFFVIRSFHDGDAIFERIRSIVTAETGFECITAEDLKGASEDIREKVHYAIDSAAFVLADISELRPNIYYEIGYAVARGRPVLLLARDGVETPTDLNGLELIRYKDTRDRWPQLEQALRLHVRVHADSDVSLSRAMIVPREAAPSYVLSSPKFPNPDARFTLQPEERVTYGDYLGIRGIFTAYARVFGEHYAPELLSAVHAAEDLCDSDGSFFLIGSPKVNPWTDRFLSQVQTDRAPHWRFCRCPLEAPQLEDYEVHLESDDWQSPCWNRRTDESRPNEDFGLIVRGPHPKWPNRMITIMAGPHSLGSAAACLAATRTPLIRQVMNCFGSKLNLGAQDRAFWVLVRGTRGPDQHLSLDGVTVERFGVYE